MRSALVWTTLAVLGGSAAATPIGRPWDLMDLAGGGSRFGAEVSYHNVDSPGPGNALDVFELDAVGQFEVSRTLDLWVRLPMGTGENDGVLGDVGVGVIAKIHDAPTSTGRLVMGIEGGVFLPTASDPTRDNGGTLAGMEFSRTFLLARVPPHNLTLRGGMGLRYETGHGFFNGDLGLDMFNETKNRDTRNDNTHFVFHLGGGGGAEVARNLELGGEFTYVKGVDDDLYGDNAPAIGITGGLRYHTGRVTLGGGFEKSIDLPLRLSQFGLRFDVIAYF